MKIQISQKRIIPGNDVLVVWSESTEDVDIMMYDNRLTFKPKSIEAIYAFKALQNLDTDEIISLIKNWKEALVVGGLLFITEVDFEYVSRSFVGGDLNVDEINEIYNGRSITQASLAKLVITAGFRDDNIRAWVGEVAGEGLFPRKDYELILEVKNHE